MRKLCQKKYKFKPINNKAIKQLNLNLVEDLYIKWKYIRELKSISADDKFKHFIIIQSVPNIYNII